MKVEANMKKDVSAQIIEKAKEFQASLAGIVSVKDLKKSPSHVLFGKLADYSGEGTREVNGKKRGEVLWPEGAKSAIIIALTHPDERPELDWWKKGSSGGTDGNLMLIATIDKLSKWLEEGKGIKTIKLPYHIERGSIFMKDAAVMAGLGCIGKNNILVTPEYGPRVRLRAMLTDKDLPATGPIDFDPCKDCPMPCIKACPQKAYRAKIYSKEDYGLDKLPGRTGVYNRELCNLQMEDDVKNYEEIEIEGQKEPGKLVKYCRLCELACPVGKA